MTPFLDRCRDGIQLGAYLAIESPFAAHTMGRAGFDWFLVDMEHAPLSAREATSLTHALVAGSKLAGDGGSSASALIRIPANSVEWVKWALDAGAHGVVAPMVQTAAEAAQLARYARYPAAGGQRSFGPFNTGTDAMTYFARDAPHVAVIAMIESREGVANAEAILATEGIGGVFIGPVDLRLSMGLAGAVGAETEYVAALAKIASIGRRLNKPVGIFSASPAAIREHAALGFSFLLVAGDSTALASGAKLAVEGARGALREKL